MINHLTGAPPARIQRNNKLYTVLDLMSDVMCLKARVRLGSQSSDHCPTQGLPLCTWICSRSRDNTASHKPAFLTFDPPNLMS